MYKARERYSMLSSGRTQFLDTAVECSELTLPYLVDQMTMPQANELYSNPTSQ